MAFASASRRIVTNSSILQSQFSSIRLNSTLATPKLLVSGLSRLTTDKKLKEAFAPFGQLVEAKVVMDEVSGRSKGFAFVTYATLEEAEQARKKMNTRFLDGWVIFVDPAKPREERPPPEQDTQSSETGFRVNKNIGWCG
ncbi:hypothetical protein Vadar_009382 [Vaccinium darrowii]|uniref:Uncharacterized protein n=1 Tax=Vaccinium darrowii TaxID=229202 RepID=A0ACB7XPI8_9ERIC|nr:hypothetical protein Vadar_009382 [Vaccinium darrowii]